jgi:sulfur relay protein TusB/DsrH
MAALHIIASAPDVGAALQNCSRAAAPDDVIVLIGNGVYCAAHASFRRVANRSRVTRWYALGVDLARRGIAVERSLVSVIDDAAFVDLVVNHLPIVSWS